MLSNPTKFAAYLEYIVPSSDFLDGILQNIVKDYLFQNYTLDFR